MSDSLHVWVSTSALDVAIYGTVKKHATRGLPGEDDSDSDFVDWGWAYANLLNMGASGDAKLEITIKDEESEHNGKTIKMAATSLKEGKVVMANKYGSDNNFTDDSDDEDNPQNFPDDLIVLTHLHEPAVVRCLRERYADDKIYTATGPILLALNPFKNCKSLYTEKKMKEYWAVGERSMIATVDESQKLPPHVYGIADNSFRIMMHRMNDDISPAERKRPGAQKSCDQSILVSGESGAGKTVTTKFIMQYLAKLSQRSNTNTNCKEAKASSEKKTITGEAKTVEQQVLQSNPILESFGNARTIRNDNSSRFGKFIEMKFEKNGSLIGASIETYLLEKVRLISQSEGERNYHIFYELFCMEDDALQSFRLADYTIEDFTMTNMSGTYDRRDGVSDYETFEDLKNAMETMGLSPDEQSDVLSIPCAALHGSNVTFLAKSADESELDSENVHLEPFFSLLGITPDALDKALCYLKIKAGKEMHTRTLPKAKAEKGMKALIKAFYGALFTFLVQRINSSITIKDDACNSHRRAKGSHASIGVLDIFGFESFKQNSFEQLCINYCNEALQQQFNVFVLKNEQEEYEREGIEWSFISFPENQGVLDLIDKKGTGILKILDDQCRAPGTTDKTFYQDLTKKCMGHCRFEANALQIGSQKFGVLHYAGPVEYDANGFVEKNRDELPKEAHDLLMGSNKEIIKALAGIISDPDGGGATTAAKSRAAPTNGPTKTVTVGGQFSRQLHDLRSKIDLTSPHYVRCLKPNDILIPDHFDPLIISDQLRYAGVIEAVRVSRVGYPQRYTHATFLARYRIMGIAELKKAQRATKKKKPVNILCEALAPKVWVIHQYTEEDKEEEEKKADLDGSSNTKISLLSVGIQVGKTKVFLRRKAYDILEQLRSGKMGEAAIKVQTIARGYILQRDFLAFRSSIISLQCLTRIQIAIQRIKIAREHHRATRIQTTWRKGVAQRHFGATLVIARWMQRLQRGKVGRQRYEGLNRERKAVVIQKYWKMYYLSKLYRNQRKNTIVIQCATRCVFARRELKKLRLGARDLSSAVGERDELRKQVYTLRKKIEEASVQAKIMAKNTAGSASASELEEARQRVEEVTQEVNTIRQELKESQKTSEEYVEKTALVAVTLAAAETAAASGQMESEKLKQQIMDVSIELEKVKATLSSKDEEIQSILGKLKAAEDASSLLMQNDVECESLKEQLYGATKELDGAKEKVAEAAHVRKDLTIRNEALRKELEISQENVDNNATVPNAASAEDLDLARLEIQELKAQLLSASSQSPLTHQSLISTDDMDLIKLEMKALKQKSAAGKKAARKEIVELKQQLAEMEDKNAGTVVQAVDSATIIAEDPAIANDLRPAIESSTTNEAAAEEILILQDEVSRLNKEMNDLKALGDVNSPQMLASRYEELRRLAEAGLEKDKEIDNLKRMIEYHSEEQTHTMASTDMTSTSTSTTDIDRLKNKMIDNLTGDLDSFKTDDPSSCSSLNANDGKPNNIGFQGRLINPEDDMRESSEPLTEKGRQLMHQVDTLKEVNELLRKDVVRSRKEINLLKFKLREEAELSRQELEAFAETLKGVDELRKAAESMSRELSAIKRAERERVNLGGDGTAESETALREATRIVDSARAHYEAQESGDTVAPPPSSTSAAPFWEGIMTLPANKKKKKKKKKKRRGSGNSLVSAFF